MILYRGNSIGFQKNGLDSNTGIFVKKKKKESPSSLYQQWENYPESPVLTSEFPYQCITSSNGSSRYLFVFTDKFYFSGTRLRSTNNIYGYLLTGQTWVDQGGFASFNTNVSNTSRLYEANNDIYTDLTFTTVFFSKTT